MRFPFNLKYLHEKPLPRIPLWNPGNPRHKLFLPLYWLRMVKHHKPLPNDFVKFECHWQMTANDVKLYLERLYNLKTLDVRVEIIKGKYIEHPKKPGMLSPPMDDRKYVYVQLKDQTFTFPSLFVSESESQKDDNEAKKSSDSVFKKKKGDDIQKQISTLENTQNKIKNKNLERLDIGAWFQ